jgi:hypothetical protein
MTAISFNQIRAEVAALRRKRSVDKPVGIRSSSRWLGPDIQADGDITYTISQCDSPLALRQALRRPAAGNGPAHVRVVVTSLDDADISLDVFSRLHRQRLFTIDRWSLVQQIFSADSIDPRLVAHDWLADAVVEHLGGRRTMAVKSGFLDAETLWHEMLAATIGLSADVPDLAALFRWSLDGANVRRLRELPPPLRGGVEAWLRSRGGQAADFVFAAADRSDLPDAVPLALAVGVLVDDAVRSKAERMIGKLEGTWLAGRRLEPADLERAAGEAAAIVRAHVADPLEQRRITTRAEELLAAVDGSAFAHASGILPLGYTQRLATFAAAARHFAADPTAPTEPVEQAADRVRQHDQIHAHPGDRDRLEMAIRLVRWLRATGQSTAKPGSLAEAARDYIAVGSYIDWARTTAGRVAATRELTDAIAVIHEAASRVQEQHASEFAGLLASAVAGGLLPDGIIPVERVLDEVVAPLARTAPVLLIVLDGMSAAVCRELVASIADTRKAWAAITPAGTAAVRPALAAIPSETRYSRASLLAGRLTAHCRDEKAAFAGHEGLRSASTSGGGPLLYAKSDYDEGRLTDAMRDEIGSPGRRVIATIVNAVDDHLAKADQVDVRWSPESIPLLDGLLHEAATANRLVVITSDHGHVLEAGTTARVRDGGERWRPAGDELASDELLLHGPRVLAPGGEIVTSWSEKVRYIAPTKRGYHGGVNPQEMVVPIAVLGPAGKPEPEGWQFVPESAPAWWYAGGDAPIASPSPTPPSAPPPGMLFDIHRDVPPTTVAPSSASDAGSATGTVATPDWVVQVFATEVYALQREMAARAHPGDDLLGRVLTALDARGGKLTKPALARAIAYPLFRMPGLLSNVQRVLNVDGYPVVAVDAESDTVHLDRELLLVQFGVARGTEGRR